MDSIQLTDDQIIDLIFEKKLMIDNISVSSKHSCLGILAKLDQRLRDGKIIGSQNTVFCRPANSENSRSRSHSAIRKRHPGREKMHVEV